MKVKKYNGILIVIVILIGACNVFGQNAPDKNFIDRLAASKQKQYQNYFKDINTTTGNEYDLSYHRIHWYVDPGIREISGEITSYFTIQQNNVNDITFDFSDTLTIDSIIYHGNSQTFSTMNDVLTIQLPQTLNQNDFDSVSVYYHGVPRKDGNRTFGQALQDTINYPVPIIWTLSEPYGSKEWWPCKQNLNDKVDSVDIFITTPSQYRSSSNGMLLSETTNGNDITAFWKHRYPITAYLIAIAVSDYTKFDQHAPLVSGGNVLITNYVYPHDSANWANEDHVLDFMRFYDSLFIAYPFINEKYGHTQFEWLGGMEHQTNSFMYNLGYELVAHELAHMWFGDYVTCGNWQDIWLNEGFATYLTGIVYEFVHPDPVWWPIWKNLQIQAITEHPDGSVFCSDTTSVERIFSGRLSYKKGAYLLHMLRWEVGDSAFFEGIRNYLNDTSVAYGFAKTDDLVFHIEEAADTSITEFMNDWFYGEGYPSYVINWDQTPDSMVTLTISQTTSHISVDFFEMHVPIRFWGNNTDTMMIFKNSLSGQNFSFKAPFLIDSIILDPDKWIIQKNSQIIQNIPEIIPADRLMIYPIPSNDKLIIEHPAKMTIKKVSIYDSKGNLYKTFNQLKDGPKLTFDTTNIESGIYLLEIQTPIGNIYKKVIIQH